MIVDCVRVMCCSQGNDNRVEMTRVKPPKKIWKIPLILPSPRPPKFQRHDNDGHCIDFFCVFDVTFGDAIESDLACDCGLQLRVIRAFKSTLEDLEEKRSEHSVHSLRSSRSQSGLRPLSDITYIDDDPLLKAAASQHHSPGERELHDRSRPPIAFTSDGLLAVAGGGGGGGGGYGSGGGGGGGGGHHHHQRQQRHSSAEHSNNNNNRATERKSASAGANQSASQLAPTVNGHHVNQQPTSRSHSNSQFQASHANDSSLPYLQSTMSPPQLLTPYQAGGAHYQLPPQMPPSSLLPVRYDVLDYDPLPDLPADLPRLVHETSI